MSARTLKLSSAKHSPGFTLIELVISAAVMSLILASAYLCLSSGVSSQRLVESRAEVLQSARVALAIMSADLRGACPLSKEFAFLGMRRRLGEVEADNLDFATHNYTPRRAREGDFCQVSYFLQKDPESGAFGLWRRRNPAIAPDPLSGGTREEIALGLRGLRFEYYDGFEWYDEWGDAEGRGKAQNSLLDISNLAGMPEAVRITLWFDPRAPAARRVSPDQETAEPPLKFQTVARLNLAAIARSASSSGSSSSGGTEAPGRAKEVTAEGRSP